MLEWTVLLSAFVGNWVLRFLTLRLEDLKVEPPTGSIKDAEVRALVHCIFTVTDDATGQDPAYETIVRSYRVARKNLLLYLQTLREELVRHEKRAMRRAHVIGIVVWLIVMAHTFMTEGKKGVLPMFLSYQIGMMLAVISPYIGYGGILRFHRQVVKGSFFVPS